jgi:hypothetical protein
VPKNVALTDANRQRCKATASPDCNPRIASIAKHRGIWPTEWLCGAIGVSRGGFYAWLTRPRSQRSRSDEELGAKVRASFLASDRTYGARRVWHDLLAEGVSCVTPCAYVNRVGALTRTTDAQTWREGAARRKGRDVSPDRRNTAKY